MKKRTLHSRRAQRGFEVMEVYARLQNAALSTDEAQEECIVDLITDLMNAAHEVKRHPLRLINTALTHYFAETNRGGRSKTSYDLIAVAIKQGLESSDGNCLDGARERGVVLRRILKEIDKSFLNAISEETCSRS